METLGPLKGIDRVILGCMLGLYWNNGRYWGSIGIMENVGVILGEWK